VSARETTAEFPDAWYVILSSRLIPDLDGGYTVATLARARQMAEAGVDGGRGPLLLTLDPGRPADHAAHRAEFVRRGAIARPELMRNLFDDASAPEGGVAHWLRQAVRAGDRAAGVDYRTIPDADDRPVVDLPVIAGDPDWHTSTAPVAVRDERAEVVGVLDGFGALYRAWLDSVVEELRAAEDKPVVLICESRQLGELLAHWRPEGVRLVHTIHIAHLLPPYTPDAPVNALWERWFQVADRFDAVLWPTPQQKHDVEARFGAHPGYALAANAAPVTVAAPAPVEGKRLVMLNRLAPVKRVDHAIRAWVRVATAVPDATLEIWGDGALRDDLQALIDDLGLSASVVLRGRNDAGPVVFDGATAMVQSSAYEGQGLSTLEAMSRGCPVIAYDVPYGPRDQLESGAGVLVADPGGQGDIDALTDAMILVLTDADARERMAVRALETARRFAPEAAASALAAGIRHALQ
jgi:glycosyltransferase involved in cell wall biosynthesis